MRIILLARNTAMLDALKRGVERAGDQVVHAAAREAGTKLLASLQGTEGDVLLLEAACDDVREIDAVERLTAERPGLLVLMASDSRDPESLIAAMRAGVQEVLHSPVDPAEVEAALRRTARRMPAAAAVASKGRIVAFIASKGGSGATFLATNFAHLAATEAGKKVALIDLDLEYGDASAFLTDQRPKATIADVARHIERLDAKLLMSSMTKITPELSLLSSSEDPETAFVVTGAQVERVLDVARASYDLVVIDLGRVLDGVAIKAMDRADVICPVMEDLIPYIRDAKRLVKSFRSLGYPDSKIHLVVNRHDRRSGIALADLEKAVGVKVRHTIPNSFEAIAESINSGVPLVKVAPRNPVVTALRELMGQLLDLPVERGWVERLVSSR